MQYAALDLQVAATRPVSTLDLINWKVGDTANYDVALAFGKGSMKKAVTKDEGTALWVTNDLDIVIQKQKVEMLINKADAKILKMLVNGQEQQIPDDKIEIISQDYATVTVPAGTFKSMHIVAKSSQGNVEVWVNPKDTCMEGTLKQIVGSMMGDITMSLTSFTKMP
jgi:hypothetical protein